MLKSFAFIITISIGCFVPFTSQSQILNIEKFRLDKDTSKIWMGNMGFGFSGKKQQNYVSQYNAYFNLAYLSDKHSYMTINYTNVQMANSQNIISEGYTHWRVNFMRRKLISYEPFAQLQYDWGRGLQRRSLVGFSFRLNVLKYNKEKKNKVEIGINEGIMYEHEKWQGTVLHYGLENDTTRAETMFIKNTTSIFTRINLHEKATLFSIVYYQARYDFFFHPRIISDIQLVFTLSKHFSFSNQFVSTVDTYPIIQNNQFTYSLSSNLIIKIK